MELSKNRLHHRRQKVRSVLIMKKRCCGLNRWWVVLLCSSFLAAHGTVRAAELYQNPVAAGDYPDPSVIRVGKDYWATATSSEWGPPFPILHSTDLVNWERLGVVFPRRPEWTSANFWAPEISYYKGRYYVYYVARKKGGPLAVAVATADRPTGPYTDHGLLVAQSAGSIDPVPVTDEKGQRYLIWKEDGNSRRLPTILWAQPLSDDGLKLIGEAREILRNDAGWEGAVVEGPFVVRRGEWFYLFYSGSGCCGKGCAYALGVARSRSLLGPWEKNPTNPILAGNDHWKCPGHGSIVEDEKGRYWLMYHAYSAKNFVFTGREGLLDEVKFGTNGWPEINGGAGPSVVAESPFGAPQNQTPAQIGQTGFVDEFDESALKPGWQWPQDNEPVYQLASNDGGQVLLAPRPELATNLIGAIFARSTTTGDYEAIAVLKVPGQGAAGIAAIGDQANATGLCVRDGKLVLWRRDKGNHKSLAEVEAPHDGKVQLRLQAAEGHIFRFSAKAGTEDWIYVGEPQPGDHLPPWDRSIRVGLTAGGTTNAAAFDRFQMRPSTAKK